uniref:Uncharacterized protein n=1 Tax=Vespula pensylvanica TaxID=30213 RepID=A0A834PAG9_VESPE|nr:hypothetical protein H0235_002895 [Vespula pensylvanica]
MSWKWKRSLLRSIRRLNHFRRSDWLFATILRANLYENHVRKRCVVGAGASAGISASVSAGAGVAVAAEHQQQQRRRLQIR